MLIHSPSLWLCVSISFMLAPFLLLCLQTVEAKKWMYRYVSWCELLRTVNKINDTLSLCVAHINRTALASRGKELWACVHSHPSRWKITDCLNILSPPSHLPASAILLLCSGMNSVKKTCGCVGYNTKQPVNLLYNITSICFLAVYHGNHILYISFSSIAGIQCEDPVAS